jgi:Ni/Co efflux regulator RcnB
MKFKIVLFVTLFSAASLTIAAVQPAGIFTDGTVLQQGEPVRVRSRRWVRSTTAVPADCTKRC